MNGLGCVVIVYFFAHDLVAKYKKYKKFKRGKREQEEKGKRDPLI